MDDIDAAGGVIGLNIDGDVVPSGGRGEWRSTLGRQLWTRLSSLGWRPADARIASPSRSWAGEVAHDRSSSDPAA